jgi:hypothetical protein
MTSIRILVLFVFALLVGCVDSYDIKDTSSNGILVVEGVLSNQHKQHEIHLSRATSLNDKRLVPEIGAEVTISDDVGVTLVLTEHTAGAYRTPEFSAEPGRSYTLTIKTDNGIYTSKSVLYNDGPGIHDVYAKYIDNPNGEGKGIQIFTDTEDPGDTPHYYRWNYFEAYEVHAPFPSNWIWLGGSDVEFRIDGIDTCYAADTLRTILIRNTNGQEKNGVTAQRIRYIPDFSHIFRYHYTILVQQISLSEESFTYWNNLRIMSENQGSLSDLQPGSVTGNITSVTNAEENVFGYFDVGRVEEKRIKFNAITFYNDGLKMPKEFRSNCYDISPIEVPEAQLAAAMKQYERTMLIWEVAGMRPAAIFSLRPKSCCDCRDQGPTTRPDFF